MAAITVPGALVLGAAMALAAAPPQPVSLPPVSLPPVSLQPVSLQPVSAQPAPARATLADLTSLALPALPQPIPGLSDTQPAPLGSLGPAGSAAATSAPSATSASATSAGTPPRQLIVPDLIAALPTGVSAGQLASIGKLAGVRSVLPVSGGQLTVNGKKADVIGVAPQAFRSWTPPQTAAAVAAWTGLADGDLLASSASAGELGLKSGTATQVAGATTQSLTTGAAEPLSVPGVDAVVDAQRAAQLGLIENVAVLINAPGDQLSSLMSQVRNILGSHGQVVNLVQVVVASKLPVASVNIAAGEVPANYLMLYEDSAQRYCPGLSWTVLAAIGEIESGDGVNDGPSTAGALGPMQFMPSTWAIWGIDGFGPAGPPDIMNALDAVPSAARMLCADGATQGSAGLSGAIFDYNHATWYVNEVLDLAAEYAAGYH